MTSTRRPPPDLRRGSWFAQQGGSGLRVGGGVQGQGAQSLGARGRGAAAAPSESSGRSREPTSSSRTNGGRLSPGSSDISDALDELLCHAKVTLKQLDALRSQQTASSKKGQEAKGASTGVGSGGASSGAAARQAPQYAKTAGRKDPRKRPGFWRPSCNAHLWSGSAAPGAEDSLSQLGSDDEDLASTSESEGGDADWDFLRRGGVGGGAFRSSPASQAAASMSGGGQFPRRGYSMPPPMPPPPPRPPSVGARDRGKPAPGAAPPGGGSSGRQAGATRHGSGYQRSGSEPPEPPDEEQRRGSGGPHRGHNAGFRFGGATERRKAQEAAAATGPEAEITATLEAAQSAGGADAGRQALKRLLLRWHPDKAPRGDEPEAKSAQAEATRVLRFILQERERLGL